MGKHGRSQSRLLAHFYPALQASFPAQLGGVSLESFYRAINKVERSLIRTDADEVTYNLHVMMRFDLELDLLEGRLQVKDLPEAWRERMQSRPGPCSARRSRRLPQDVHWYGGPSAAGSRATPSAIFSARSSMMPRCKADPEISPRSRRESTARSTDGCATRLSTRAQVQARTSSLERATGERNGYRVPTYRVPSKQVRRALSNAKYLMQAILGDRIGEIWIP